MNSLDPKMECAVVLFREVFTVCRAKSNVPLAEWKLLQAKIESFLKDEIPDVEPYKKTKIVIAVRDKVTSPLQSKVDSLKAENKRLKDFIRVYQGREMQIKRVLSGNLYSEYLESRSANETQEENEV